MFSKQANTETKKYGKLVLTKQLQVHVQCMIEKLEGIGFNVLEEMFGTHCTTGRATCHGI